MLWSNLVDVDCDLDTVTYIPRTRTMLCVAGMVRYKIRRVGVYHVGHHGRNHDLECSHDLLQTLDGEPH